MDGGDDMILSVIDIESKKYHKISEAYHKINKAKYGKTSVARTLMARLLRLLRTRS